MKKMARDTLLVASKKLIWAEFFISGTRYVLLSLLLVTCNVLLPSCGYHLRGAYQLPPQMATTVIKADNMNSELVRSLKRGLETSGVTVIKPVVVHDGDSSTKSSAAVLRIVKETHDKRVLSVDALGRAREYDLQYEIVVELSGADGLLVPEQTLQMSRDFLFDPEDVLGKSDEEADILRDMQQDMVRLILLRLQAASQKKNVPAPAPLAP